MTDDEMQALLSDADRIVAVDLYPLRCREVIAKLAAALTAKQCVEGRIDELETKLAKVAEAMDVDFIEQAISDVLSEGGTYRDAAEYVTSVTLAELKGEK